MYKLCKIKFNNIELIVNRTIDNFGVIIRAILIY